MKRIIFILASLFVFAGIAGAKDDQYNANGDLIKTGWNLGPLPVVAFDADRGFQYGALLNLYNFGDGSNYPNPNETWYFEASAYTGGTSKFIVNYDNKYLIPGVRLSVCTSFSNEKALDFYGFNGYQSIYDPSLSLYVFDSTEKGDKFATDLKDNGVYPNGFYRLGRRRLNAKVDLTGEINKNLFWEAGYTFNYIKISDFVPEGYTVVDGSLYSLYKMWGIIPDNQAGGGIVSALKAGLMYDSRNVENNPTRGIWAETHLIAAPKFLGTTHGFAKINATFRHYVPLVPERLTFAYRLAYQGFLGDAPWYMLPFYNNMGLQPDREAIGGYRTVRGIMLNRVQGLHTGFFNAELRWRFIDFTLFNQNIAFALSGFCDGAQVFKGYDISNKTGLAPLTYNKYVNIDVKDSLHAAAGVGLRFIMNQNFIVAAEYARSFNAQDGKGAFYLNTGFLF